MQCWYTAVDMQLYVVAPLVLIPLLYRPKIGRSQVLSNSIGLIKFKERKKRMGSTVRARTSLQS